MAFLVGSFLNAYVMSKMKVASRGRHFSARAILSTLAGETADSLIFFPVAFGGIIAWRELLIMMCIQIILKSMYAKQTSSRVLPTAEYHQCAFFIHIHKVIKG